MGKDTHSTETHGKLQHLMSQLLAGMAPAELKNLQSQFDELEARVTAEECNKMEKLLHHVVSAKNIQKTIKS